MSLSAGVLRAEPYPVTALHKELPWSAGAGCVLPIAGMRPLPVDIPILALTSRPPRLWIMTEKLTLATGAFCFQLEALA